jgi:hypothetical protein
VVPAGEGKLVAVICSRRVLGPAELAAAQSRIRRGEPLRPTAALLDRARRVLSGEVEEPARLSPPQMVALAFGNLLLTPILGYAVWWRWRDRQGPGARQALLVTLPVSLVLAVLLVLYRTR